MTTIKGFILALTVTTFGFSVTTHSNAQPAPVQSDLFGAIQSIDYVSLNILLADGASVDTVDRKGNTPLMQVAKIGNPRMLSIILSHEPDLNRTNESGNTALMIAAESGLLHVVEELIRRGANADLQNEAGSNARTLASRYGHTEIAQLLSNREYKPSLAR